MAGTKTLRGNTTIWAVRPEAFTNWATPISAATWATAVTAGLITDISCAVEDGYKMNLTGSKTSTTQSVCDIAAVDSPVFSQYDVSLSLFRNKPGDTDMPIYDIAMSLFDAPGISYYLVKRVDKAQGAAVAAGDILSAYAVSTDLPTDIPTDNGMLMFGAQFTYPGGVHTNQTVTA